MVKLEPTPEGVLLQVQAQPKARKNAVVGIHDGRLKVAVTQVPEKGKANQVLVKVLADALGLRRSQIELHSGAGSSKKSFLVGEIDVAELQKRIADCVKSIANS